MFISYEGYVIGSTSDISYKPIKKVYNIVTTYYDKGHTFNETERHLTP